MNNRRRLCKIHGQFDGLTREFWKVDKFEELVVLAPKILLSAEFHVEPSLFPIAHGRELFLRGGAGFPQIEKHRLPHSPPKFWQWRNGGAGGAYIFNVLHPIVTLIDDHCTLLISIREPAFLLYGYRVNA